MAAVTLDGPDGGPIYGVEELARMRGVSRETWMRWVKEGRAPAPRADGKTPYYTRADVACYLHLAGRWGPEDTPGDDG